MWILRFVDKTSWSKLFAISDHYSEHGTDWSWCVCDKIRFHKFLELITAELWSIITNFDVCVSVYGNNAFHMRNYKL